MAGDKKNSIGKCLNHHYLYIVITIWICFYNSLWGQFVFDDIPAIVNNQDMRWDKPIANLFKHDYWGNPIKSESSHKSFRPITTITFRWNFYLSGLNPVPYHITNVVLHCIVCCLFYKLCCELVSQSLDDACVHSKPIQGISFKTALLFAVHPIHTEVVSNIVGRSELLSAVFFLLSLLLYMKSLKGAEPHNTRWSTMAMSLILSVCAMLSKENGLTVLAICGIYEIVSFAKYMRKFNLANPKGSIKIFPLTNTDANIDIWNYISTVSYRLLALITILISCLIMRYSLMGGNIPYFISYDNPASHAPPPIRQMTYSYLASLNFWKLINPSTLSCDWSMNSIPLIKSPLEIRLFSAILLGTLILVACTKDIGSYLSRSFFHQRSQNFEIMTIMGWAILIIPFLPASNLFYPVGFVLAERVLYTSSMGACLLINIGHEKFKQLLPKKREVLNRCYLILVLLFAVKTVVRNKDWSSEKAIMGAGIRVVPSNAKLWNNMGHCYEEENKLDLALKSFTTASKKQYDDVGAYINIGRVHQKLYNYKAAEMAYERAVSLLNNEHIKYIHSKTRGQKTAIVHKNIKATQETNINGLSKNENLKVYHIPHDWLNVYIMMGDLISRNKSRIKEADYYYLSVLKLNSNHPIARMRLIHSYEKMNKRIKPNIQNLDCTTRYSNQDEQLSEEWQESIKRIRLF